MLVRPASTEYSMSVAYYVHDALIGRDMYSCGCGKESLCQMSAITLKKRLKLLKVQATI